MSSCLRVVLPLIIGVTLSACDAGRSTALVLPEGDPEQGRDAFVQLQCHACHTVQGIEMPEPTAPSDIMHTLGGQRAKTYQELVTSVINPSHRIAGRFRPADPDADEGSPMLVYNDVMTVTQLVDLVAFLQAQYKIDRPPRYRYLPLSATE